MGNYRPNNYQPRHSWHTDWTDERHPKIKTMMSSYLERTNGRVHLAEILGAAGKKQMVGRIQMDALSCAGRVCLGNARIANAVSTNRGDILIKRISATNLPAR